MSDVAPRPRPAVRLYLIVPLLLLIVGAAKYRLYRKQEAIDSAKNFEMHYQLPVGWKAAPHGPETLFREIQPQTGVVLRGAANQVIDASNPTPDLTTAGIAKFYEDRTDENMPDWKATELPKAQGDGFDFAVLRRSTKNKVVVTAYAVKGNTTVLLSLYGAGKSKNLVDPALPVFYGMLKTISLQEKDMSNL